MSDKDTDEEFTAKVLKALGKWFDTEKLKEHGFSLDGSVCDDCVFEFVLQHEDGADEPFCRLEKEEKTN